MNNPHDGVCARLAPSPIHGVGVFAILQIPQETSIFEPDDDLLVDVPESSISETPVEIRKLYRDFCLMNSGVIQ
jgi:hypothetical protein